MSGDLNLVQLGTDRALLISYRLRRPDPSVSPKLVLDKSDIQCLGPILPLHPKYPSRVDLTKFFSYPVLAPVLLNCLGAI